MILLAVVISMMLAVPAFADYDEDELKEIEQKLQAGENFDKNDFYPPRGKYSQVLRLRNGGGYLIDFRARLCFHIFQSGTQIIPSRAIKIGYPKIGKLITWEKDGHAK